MTAWYGAAIVAVVCLTGTIAVYGLCRARAYRLRLAAVAQEAERLAEETLPTLAARLRAGVPVNTAVAAALPPSDPGHRKVLLMLAEEVRRGERRRAAAMAACATAVGRVQALSTSMLADLREMEHRHGEEVLGDLMRLDHRTAQTGRFADSIAVLTGARTGRRWTRPIEMESILRGAVGRISDYQRVRLNSASRVAVAGHAAEGVMHALAELMDNATSFSPPTSEVHVYVEELHTGVVVTVEDGGLVMSESALARAQQAVSAEPLDLASLSGTRLGLPVVGCLARKHGLTVSFRPSARGGTGVVVVIPQQLISRPAGTEDQPGASAVRPGPDRAPMTERTPAPGDGGEGPRPAHGLPRRRRGQALTTASRSSAVSPQLSGGSAGAGEDRQRPTRPRADAAARFGAFHRARRKAAEGPQGAVPVEGSSS